MSSSIENEPAQLVEAPQRKEAPQLAGESKSRDEGPRRPFASLPPRAHNTLSYGVAMLVLPVFLNWGNPGAFVVGAAWSLHFARRAAESLFVHRYSGRAVPLSDWFLEYVYYWGFAYWIARGVNGARVDLSAPLFAVGLGIFLLGESGNAWAHQKLRALRTSSGERERKLPGGGMFELVSCPHYLFEITSWIGFSFMTRVLGAYAFLAMGAVILATYARSRHLAYRKEFDGREGRALYPPSRRALLPFLF